MNLLKVALYIITLFASIFAYSGVDFDQIMRKNKPIEARILVLFLSFATSYLVTNFITDLIAVSSIIKK
ncbi:MAG: DUF1146 domain-containing protein [Bacilli bacterium]|nr:DUF1146 domain-containing protein [Bacilli bacterium]